MSYKLGHFGRGRERERCTVQSMEGMGKDMGKREGRRVEVTEGRDRGPSRQANGGTLSRHQDWLKAGIVDCSLPLALPLLSNDLIDPL